MLSDLSLTAAERLLGAVSGGGQQAALFPLAKTSVPMPQCSDGDCGDEPLGSLPLRDVGNWCG